MSREGSIDRLRDIYAEWAKGNFRAGRDLFAPDLAFEPRSPDQNAVLAADDVEEHMRGFLAQWSEYRVEAQEFTEFGDTVLVTERQTGTGRSSGVEIDQVFYAAWTFRDGFVVSLRWDTDRDSALEAAGLSE